MERGINSLERSDIVSLERAKELLNALIDNALVGEKQSNVIKHLLYVGFTEQELVEEFNFNKNDVEEANSDMKHYEEE